MTFNSPLYFLFLPFVFLVFSCTRRYRWAVLLAASYGFYATFQAPEPVLVLVLVTGISYACGRMLGNSADQEKRRRIFWTGVAACLLVLAAVKYLPPLLRALYPQSPSTPLLVSIGVSYFTFQAISYLSDVYLEIQDPEPHLGYHALSLAFFPKLLQGPIERAGDLMPQLKKEYCFDYGAVRSGMLLFGWGLFQKVVLADRLALYADSVYENVHAYNGLPLLLATYCYAFQLYFDFAGYTDMARGTSRIFGIELSANFKSPYLATSISDFWRRWHISFSRWILDYIFKPLQMAWRDHDQAGTAAALLMTFLISGLWHGATWGFVVWGLLHGVFLAASTYYRPYQKKLHGRLLLAKTGVLRGWQVLVTFNMVSFSWIFFRADTLQDAWYVVTHIFGNSGGVTAWIAASGWTELLRLCLALLLLMPVTLLKHQQRFQVDFFTWPVWLRWPVYCGFCFSLLILYTSNNQYIYFKF